MAVSVKVLARWYRVLAQNLRAGLPLQQAISRSAGPPARDRKRMTARLAAGDPLDEVLRNAPKWLPETDRYVLSSAAESGRLVEGLQILAEKHSFAAAQRAKAVAAMIYPLFVIHLGVILVPLRVAILEGVDAYLRLVGGILVPLWAVLAILIWAARGRHRWLQAILRMMPLLCGYSKNRSIADLSFTLGAYFAAGETVDNAWFGAGKAAGDRRLAKLGIEIAEAARRGISPGTFLANSGRLPEEFLSLYMTGEQTGQLDENVQHLGVLFAERASAKLEQASFWYPKLLILLLAAGVAYVAITSYMAYLGEVLEMLE